VQLKQKFNKLTYAEYICVIDDRKKISNFNTLGLFRSIVETNKLDIAQKIAVRDYANRFLHKSFDFLQLKDPETYFNLITLGENLTVADEKKIYTDIRHNQQKILKNKRIKHRNFGTHSKHDCGSEYCCCRGRMIKRGSILEESRIIFDSDRHHTWYTRLKVELAKKERKNMKQLVDREWE
jgi:hypothetical protein